MPNVRPKATKLSDAMMMTRYAALWLKECALETQNAMFDLQDEMMAESGSKMMSMETGEIEKNLLELASQAGLAKEVHLKLNALGRRHNEPIPLTPTYDEDYIKLAGGKVHVRLSGVLRR